MGPRDAGAGLPSSQADGGAPRVDGLGALGYRSIDLSI